MKTIIRSFLIMQTLLLFFPNSTSAQTFEWAKNFWNLYGNGTSISVDLKGNSYITGAISGTANFDTIQLNGYGDDDIFIAKYDPAGNCLWAKQAGGDHIDEGIGIVVDLNGNSYVTGSFQNLASFDTIHLSEYSYEGSGDIFIAKYDPNGNCIWAKQAGGTHGDDGKSIVVDNIGNVYITGWYTGPAAFGTIQLNGSGVYSAKYDTNGNCLWAKQIVGGRGYGIAVDSKGNSYVTGATSDSLFDGIMFIAKSDSGGNLLWIKNLGTTPSQGNSIAVGSNGDSYSTGYFSNTATFDTIQITALGREDMYIAKYESNGNCSWVKHAWATDNAVGRGISVDTSGNSFITGHYWGTASFGSIQLPSLGVNDIFIAKYNKNGNCIWAKEAGGPIHDFGLGDAIDKSGNVFITGGMGVTATFGTIQLKNTGGFITKISDIPLPVELSSFTGKAINNSIKLEWTTQTETNNNIFEIERKNPNSTWIKIGEVKGEGTSTSPKQYSFLDKSLAKGAYYYRLKQIDYNGTYKYSGIAEVEVNTPVVFALNQNYPNPFNPTTTIAYALKDKGFVKLKVFDIRGELVKVLVNESKDAGYYETEFNGKSLASGVYIYRIEVIGQGNRSVYSDIKKSVLLK